MVIRAGELHRIKGAQTEMMTAPHVTTCTVCREPIFADEPYYHMLDGADVCEDCLEEWAKEYRLMGEDVEHE